MKSLWRRLRWSLRRDGALGRVRDVLRGEGGKARVHPFDAQYGTETGGVVGGAALGAGHAHDAYVTAYAGMPPSRFQATMERWLAEPRVAPTGEVSFVDVGCGKGRVLLMASESGFARVLGVELDGDLVRIAEENRRRWAAQRGGGTRIEIVRGDATEIALPEGPCLLYLANPFGAPVLRRLLEALETRAKAGGGTVDLIYQNAAYREVFLEFPAWCVLWVEVFELSEEDAAAEPVYGREDRCVAWRRQAMGAVSSP